MMNWLAILVLGLGVLGILHVFRRHGWRKPLFTVGATAVGIALLVLVIVAVTHSRIWPIHRMARPGNWPMRNMGPPRWSREQRESTHPVHIARQSTGNMTWSSQADRYLKADVYPSEDAAIDALGQLTVEDVLAQYGGTFRNEARFLVTGDASAERLDRLAASVRDRLASEPLGATVRVVPPQNLPEDPREESAITIVCRFDPRENRSGLLLVRWQSDHRASIVSANFRDKPWFAEPAAVGSNLFVAVSPTPQSTPLDAKRAAAWQAATTLGQHLPLHTDIRSEDRLQSWLLDRIITEQAAIADEFTQKLSSGGGDVYRTALLIDLGKSSELARLYSDQRRAERTGWLGRIGAGVAMLVGVCLIYLFLNAATRGYYAWMLRLVACVAALVGLAALVWLI